VRFRTLLVILLIGMSLLFAPVKGDKLVSIQALNNDFYAVPGDTIVVPYTVINVGNEPIGNVTVYVVGPTTGFQYGIRVVREPIPPGGTYNGTITFTVLNPEPGKYILKLVAKIGEVYSEAPITVIVKPVIDYFPRIKVSKRYVYGEDVNVSLEVVSKANTIISGRIGYEVALNGTVIRNVSSVTFVRPGGVWRGEIYLVKPSIGLYTVRLWANMSGVYRETLATFEVYRRNLSCVAEFRNGAIHVFVSDPSGSGVGGVRVYINGAEFITREDGTVTYLVTTPGVYNVVADLDGRIVKEKITVAQLAVDVAQRGNRLLIRVRAGEKPVPGIVVSVSGSEGSTYAVTNESGSAVVNLNLTGYGPLMVSAESERYLGARITFTATPPQTTTSTTTTTPVPSNISPTQTPASPKGGSLLGVIIIISGFLLGASVYLAFFSPIVQEETIDRYYFVKVKAPRMRAMKGFRFEKPITGVDVRATKGRARIEGNSVVWELDLEPGEEAYLQVLLG